MSDETHLSTHFDALGLPAPAKAWLLDLWTVIQVLDDAADGDKSDRKDVESAAWAIFVTMPMNDMYQKNAGVLQPLLALAVLKWRAANEIEAAGEADERTYVARAAYYDIVMMVCHICGIPDSGATCIQLYGETFADYILEWRKA